MNVISIFLNKASSENAKNFRNISLIVELSLLFKSHIRTSTRMYFIHLWIGLHQQRQEN